MSRRGDYALLALRVRPGDESDLRWFFTEADGDMGLRSSFSAQMTQLQMGGGRRGTYVPQQREIDGRLVSAATRARVISRALEAIGRGYSYTLRCAYGIPAHPELHGFQELAGLVADTPAAQRLHRRSRTKRPLPDWLARMRLQAHPLSDKKVPDLEAQRIVYEVRVEAESQLVAASKAYTLARRETARRRAG